MHLGSQLAGCQYIRMLRYGRKTLIFLLLVMDSLTPKQGSLLLTFLGEGHGCFLRPVTFSLTDQQFLRSQRKNSTIKIEYLLWQGGRIDWNRTNSTTLTGRNIGMRVRSRSITDKLPGRCLIRTLRSTFYYKRLSILSLSLLLTGGLPWIGLWQLFNDIFCTHFQHIFIVYQNISNCFLWNHIDIISILSIDLNSQSMIELWMQFINPIFPQYFKMFDLWGQMQNLQSRVQGTVYIKQFVMQCHIKGRHPHHHVQEPYITRQTMNFSILFYSLVQYCRQVGLDYLVCSGQALQPALHPSRIY